MNGKIEIRGCKNKDELLKVVNVCDLAFKKTPYEYFERHLLKDDTLSPEDTRILMIDGEILSSVQVFPRKIYLKGDIIDFAGIGNVATLPAKRKLGFAEMVMRDAINYMKAKDFRFSLLTTSINKYYEKFGYKSLKRELIEMTNVSSKFYDQVRKFNREKDYESIKKIYLFYNQKSIGSLYRDLIYWESQFAFCGEEEKLFLVYEFDGYIIGYIRAVGENDTIKILEFAANIDYSKVFDVLVQSLCHQTGFTKVEIFLSESEKQKLLLKKYATKIDTDLMILFWGNKLTELQKLALIKENNINFWLSDFF